ncbi:MAG: D-2-hydroxyacid dehydrogenase [Flavobacteriales bacterium]|nr:D-2-hydroxyacid dehydrogenase [Flavobacteriales bacterium]
MKVLANDGISSAGVEVMKNNNIEVLESKVAQEQLINYINENQIDALLVRSATKVRKDIIDACPSLKIIGRGGVGMDNIDVEYAKSKGLHVINTPAASSRSVAELVFGHFFAIARFLHDANRKMPLEGDSKFSELKKSYAKATELAGKTLGVVGFGRIGIETIKIGLALGMNVIVHDPFVKDKKEVQLDFFGGKSITFELGSTDFDELIKQSDFISLHVPKQKEYVLGQKQFEAMKDGVIIANAARGGVIDEEALVKAIESGKVRGAALDVFENEPTPKVSLLMNDKISLSPHIGGNTLEAQDRIGEELAEQIIEIVSKS